MSPTLPGSQSQCLWAATGEATSHTRWILLSPETDGKSPANVGVGGSDWGPSSRTVPASPDTAQTMVKASLAPREAETGPELKD